MSCMTILFFKTWKTARSDISLHIKWAVSLVFAYGHFNVHLGCEWVSILCFMLVKRIVIAANFVHEKESHKIKCPINVVE